MTDRTADLCMRLRQWQHHSISRCAHEPMCGSLGPLLDEAATEVERLQTIEERWNELPACTREGHEMAQGHLRVCGKDSE